MLKKVLRTMMEHKGRYLGAILLLVLSSMMFVGPNTVSANLRAVFEQYAADSNLSDAEFTTTAPFDAAALASQFSAQVELGGIADSEVMAGQTLRVFAAMDTVNIPSAAEGRLPGRGEILLDSQFAAANGYSIGSAITVAGQPFTVSGYAMLPNYIYVIESKDEMINNPERFGVAVVTKQDFAALPDRVDTYAIRFNDRQNVPMQEAAVKNALRAGGAGITSWQSTSRKVNVSYVPLEIGVMRTMGFALSSLMLALSSVLLGMLMWRMIRSESAIAGTLYALGYSKNELRRHYLLFPLIISGVGSLTGALLGIPMAVPFYSIMSSIFTMPFTGIQYDLRLALIAIAVPTLVLCAITWIIVGRMLKNEPAVLMRGGESAGRVNFIERRLRLDRLSFPLKFRVREQLRSLSRAFFLLFGVIAATMLMMYGFAMKSSVDYMLSSGITDVYDFQHEYVFTSARTGAPPDGTEPFNAAYVTVAGEQEREFYVTGILPDSTRIRLTGKNGALLPLNQNIATITLAQKLGLKEGDTLTVYDTENGREHVLTVDRIAGTYIGDFLFMPLADFNAEWDHPAGTYAGIWTDQPMTFSSGEIASTKSIENIVRGIQTLLDQTGPMVYALIGAAFLLGLVIIYIVSGMIVDESSHTISLMKIMGYRPGAISSLVLGSNTLVVVLGYVLGIPALLLTAGAFFASLADTLQFSLPVKLSLPYLLLGFVVVMASYALATAMSRRKVARIPMSEALKAGTE